MSKYDKVKLSELIIQKTDTEQIVDMENEHYITLSLYGKGARERVIKDGKYPVPFTGYRVSSGQFIYSRIDARNGAYAIIGPELDGFVVSKDFPVFDINESEVLPHFLRRAVLSDAFINQVKNSSFGATNRMRIKEDIFAGYSIPLPELSKQKEIVDILDRVETIINSRQQELQKLDDLIKARFIEMFGDPIDNPKSYPVHQLSEYITSLTSGSRGWAKYCVDEGKEWFITIKNVKDCHISTNNMQPVNAPDNAEAKRTKVQEGDLLISITADLGRTGVVTKEIAKHGAYINQHLSCVRINRDVLNPLFVAYYMESPAGKEQFTAKNQSAVKAGLNFNSINSLRLMVPPLTEQNRFIDFITQVDKSKLLEARQAGFIAKTRPINTILSMG